MVSQFREKELVNAVNLNASASYAIPFEQVASAAVHAVWTKTAVTGSICLQKSCNGVNWVNVGSPVDLNTATVEYFAEVENKGYHYLQLAITIGSGDLDTITAWSNVKG